MSCSATRRISIRWLPDKASEDTDTLVLSIGDYYVDIRVKSDHSAVDWAFAGTKGVKGDGRHFWIHEIDSRGLETEEDAGYMTILENGDELEAGSMQHPKTGMITQYEEVWRMLPLTQRVGYIEKSEDGMLWIARVDIHFLFLEARQGQVAVARFVKHNSGIPWQLVFRLGTSTYLDRLDSHMLEEIENGAGFLVLASCGLNG